MTITRAYTGYEQVDEAELETGGIQYRCMVWKNVVNGRVEAMCKAKLEDGQVVTVFHNIVHTPSTDAFDSPRIVAKGNFFIAHWIDVTASSESVSGAVIRKAWIEIINLHNVGSWTVIVDTLTTHVHCLYDIHTIEGDTDEDYILVHKDPAAGQINVRRQNSHLGFPADDWSVLLAVVIDSRILACYGNDTDGDGVVCYEPDGIDQVWTFRYNTSNGGGALAVQSFTGIGNVWATVAAYCRVASNRVALVIEARPTDYAGDDASIAPAYQRFIACREINTDDSTRVNNEHRTWGLTMQSRPFAFAGPTGAGLNPNVYVMLGYRPFADDGQEWTQNYGFVVNLDRDNWSQTANRVRPIPCAKMIHGDVDGREHSAGPPLQGGGVWYSMDSGGDASVGQKRMNHLSHVITSPTTTGHPDYKERAWAGITWGRMHKNTSDPDELNPSAATCTEHRFHCEEPWVRNRDPTETSTPTSNFIAAYPLANYQTLEVGRGLFGNGGVPWTYAGKQIVECGFLWAPEIVLEVGVGTGLTGTFQYYAIYTWRDESGQVHRSSPSLPQSITLANERTRLYFRSLTLTLKQSWHYSMANLISVEIFRTLAGGTVFYRLFAQEDGSVSSFEIKDTQVNLITDWYRQMTVDDNVADADLDNGDLAPFQLVQGAWVPLAPEQPPAFGPIEKWRNRIWGAATETDALELWYSKELGAEPGGTAPLAPEFSSSNVFRLDVIGAITAIKAMDNALFVFTATDVYALTGSLNDDTGVGQDLELQKIPGEGNGCIEPRSVCLTPMGIVYQSFKGIHLLNRSMQMEYIGAPVEDLVRLSGNLRRATLMEDRHSVFFVGNDALTSGGMVLVWNYLFGLWSKAEPADLHSIAWTAALADGCAWRGATGENLHVILSFGGVAYEREASNANLYQDERHDGLVTITTTLRAGWIKLSDLIAGIGRCWEIGVQLTKPSASAMTVVIDYEINGLYDASVQQTITYASAANPYLRARCSTTKCTAVRVRVSESGSPTGEAVEYHSLSFVVGVKPGLRRVPDTYLGS